MLPDYIFLMDYASYNPISITSYDVSDLSLKNKAARTAIALRVHRHCVLLDAHRRIIRFRNSK